MSDKYARRGVSSAKEDVHAAISGLSKGVYPNAFCKILPDLISGDPNKCLVMHADGAGTKSSLAYLVWKETGDLSVWKGIAQDAIVMNTDDLMCVGALGPYVFSSAIGRNKNRIPGEVVAAIIQGTKECIEHLNQWGIEAELAGGETADVGDLVQTVIVDSTLVSLMSRKNVIAMDALAAGQVIVGFESEGCAAWETGYNAGMGSNGLTSARHDVLSSVYRTKYPETFDGQLPEDVVYAGNASITDVLSYSHPFAGNGTMAMGKAILSPTRTYLPLVKQLLKEFAGHIKGMIHCSGGGQTKILHFLPEHLSVIKDNLFEVPPLFAAIHQQSGTSWQEMYRVFNMGHRLEVITDEKTALQLVALGDSLRIRGRVVGKLVPRHTHRLTLHAPGEVIGYQ
jgi:phosphoribosylformylglycinamidine cyclo-ligase